MKSIDPTCSPDPRGMSDFELSAIEHDTEALPPADDQQRHWRALVTAEWHRRGLHLRHEH